MQSTPLPRAEALFPTTDLRRDLGFFARLGFRLDTIFPADDPAVAVFSGHGLRFRLQAHLAAAPGALRLLADEPALGAFRLMASQPGQSGVIEGPVRLVAPGGTVVEVAALTETVTIPPTVHEFAVRRLADGAPWVIGRAGMHYRDLVLSRLGGSIIASHIRIPDGGPVPDMVHFHKVGFQLIFCYRGWVDVVYEDQGGPIRLMAGDCFIQPPGIRHRVLEASDGIEVIEIGVPAEHVTEIDHDMTLPTPNLRPERAWDGQRFVFNRAAGADWHPFRLPGYNARGTTIGASTGQVADVQVARRGPGAPAWATHDCDILFGFVMAGTVTLETPDGTTALSAGDAFVTPPGLQTRWAAPSDDVEILEVSLPGVFGTVLM